MTNRSSIRASIIPTDTDVQWLRTLARQLVHSDADGDDLAQDAWAHVVAHPDRHRDLRPYLSGVLRRLRMAKRRSEAVRAHKEQEAALVGTALEPPEAALERVEQLRAILEALEQLPPAQARVVSAHFVDERPISSIASASGCSPSTVRAHLARGLAGIRERMDRRFGERAAWAGPLLVWSGMGRSQPIASTAQPGPSAVSDAFGIPGLLAVALSGATALLLVALGQRNPVPKHQVGPTLSTPPIETQGPHPVELVETVRHTATAAVASTPVAERAASPWPMEFQVLDRLTGEPVPYLDLRLVPEDKIEDLHSVNISGQIRLAECTKVRTGPKGIFRKPNGIQGRQLVHVPEHSMRHGEQILRWDTASSSALEVQVGPTYQISADLPEDVEGFNFLLVPESGWNSGKTVLFLYKTPRRVRFARPFDLGDLGSGPWIYEIDGKDKFIGGRLTLPLGRGIQRDPIVMETWRTGSVQFSFDHADPQLTLWTDLEITNDAGNCVDRFRPGSSTAPRRYLRAGRYSWKARCADARASGTFVIVHREETAVSVALDSSVKSEQRIRVTGPAPEGTECAPFTTWAKLRDSGAEIKLTGFAWAGDAWETTWYPPTSASGALCFDAAPGFTVDPPSVAFTGRTARLESTLQPAPTRTLNLTISLDQAVPQGPVHIVVVTPRGQRQTTRFGPAHEVEVPLDQPWSLVVHAHGSRSQIRQGRDHPNRQHLTVDLETGWSGVVSVRDAWSGAPIEGIALLADEQAIGSSNELGLVAFDTPANPQTISLAESARASHQHSSPYRTLPGADQHSIPFQGHRRWTTLELERR